MHSNLISTFRAFLETHLKIIMNPNVRKYCRGTCCQISPAKTTYRPASNQNLWRLCYRNLWRLWYREEKTMTQTANEMISAGDDSVSKACLTQEWIQKHTKSCPKCQVRIQKWDGYDTVTCVCGNVFCYACSMNLGPSRALRQPAIHFCSANSDGLKEFLACVFVLDSYVLFRWYLPFFILYNLDTIVIFLWRFFLNFRTFRICFAFLARFYLFLLVWVKNRFK